jgi:non-heme chloroperoxidase
MTPRSSRSLKVRDVDLHIITQGRPSGPALVLLHGYGDSDVSWTPLMDALPSELRTVAVTFRGHGDSSKPANGYDVETFASDVLAVMDALDIEMATLVGHSMGSLVATRIAARHALRVTSVVLIGAFATLMGNPAVEALWHEQVSALTDPVASTFVADFQRSCLALPVADQFFDLIVAESLKVPARVWRDTLHALRHDNSGDWPGAVEAPALVVWGDRDLFADRAEQERLTASMRHARFLAHSGVGHAPHWENPRRVAQDLIAFLERLRSAPT